MFNIERPSRIEAGVIEIYDNIIENCQEIIDLSEKNNEWQDARIKGNSFDSEETINKNIRSNLTLYINQYSFEVDPIYYEMCKTVWRYCNEYSKKYKVPFYSTEEAQILKYSDGEYYDPHCDYGPGLPRVFSALLYLNDVDEGGETEFINFNLRVKPKAGRLVIFPSNYAYAHAARPPKNSIKYVSVFWMRG